MQTSDDLEEEHEIRSGAGWVQSDIIVFQDVVSAFSSEKLTK